MNIKILMVVPDDLDCFILYKELRQHGFAIDFTRVDTIEKFESVIISDFWNMIIIDIDATNLKLESIITSLKLKQIQSPVIVISQDKSIESVRHAIRLGAKSYVFKDEINTLGQVVEDSLSYLGAAESAHNLLLQSFVSHAVDKQMVGTLTPALPGLLADLEQVLCAAGNSMALLAEALDPESTESMYALLALQTTRRGEALVKEIGSRLKNPSERNYERPKLKPQKLKKQTT